VSPFNCQTRFIGGCCDFYLMETSGERAGNTVSFWERTAKKFQSAPLKENLNADVCVVGAGIAGVTMAYLLARENRQVVLIDDGPLGGGMTGRTTAQFVTLVDDGYDKIEKLLGEECARLCAESQIAAIDRVEAIVNAEKIDCDFERVDGYLFLPPGGSVTDLKRELDAIHCAGLPDVERVDRVPIGKFNTDGVLRIPRQAQFRRLAPPGQPTMPQYWACRCGGWATMLAALGHCGRSSRPPSSQRR